MFLKDIMLTFKLVLNNIFSILGSSISISTVYFMYFNSLLSISTTDSYVTNISERTYMNAYLY